MMAAFLPSCLDPPADDVFANGKDAVHVINHSIAGRCGNDREMGRGAVIELVIALRHVAPPSVVVMSPSVSLARGLGGSGRKRKSAP